MSYHERRIGKTWVQWGTYSFKAIGLGIYLSNIQCTLDLLWFWIQVELPVSKRRYKKWADK